MWLVGTALDSTALENGPSFVLEETETHGNGDLELTEVLTGVGMRVEAAAFSRKLASLQWTRFLSPCIQMASPA